jgi:hypothetical protein
MFRFGKSLVAAAVYAAFLASASAQSTAAPGSGSAENVSMHAVVPVPASPEHLPPASPQVSFLNGQLTIISHNSTLAGILAAVRQQTGAVVEMPAGAGAERVAGLFGPGAAADVLAALLNGSRFDYLMLSAPSNPNSLARLVLKTRVDKATNLSQIGTPQMRSPLGEPSSTAEQMPMGVEEQMPSGVEEQMPMGVEEQMPSADQLSPRMPPPPPDVPVAPSVPSKKAYPSSLPPNSTSRAD